MLYRNVVSRYEQAQNWELGMELWEDLNIMEKVHVLGSEEIELDE